MSNHFEKNNVQQEPDSFIYLLFSNSSKHMYVGETINVDIRMRAHLNMSRKTLPTLSAYKIWRTLGIGAMSVMPIPVPSYIRKAKEAEIIRFFAPTMNVKCIMKSHNAQIHKHKSLEFSKLCRPIPITEREHKFRKIPTEKGSKNIYVKKHMMPATAGLKHKLSPTLYKTGFGHRACQTFSSIRELFLHRHSVGTTHVVEVEVISGTSEITKIQQDTLASEVRVYDIIAVSQHLESYPFSVYTIASLTPVPKREKIRLTQTRV